MNELFGIPTGALATALALILVGCLGAIGLLAVRNRVFLKLGLRNIPRRRGRTALIVAGLMLGTAIIAAALATGDTMSHTIRSSVLTSLGGTDVLVSERGTDVESIAIGESTQVAYFPYASYHAVRNAVAESPLVDGVAPAIFETVAVQDLTTRQNEPRLTLFASEPEALSDAFATIRVEGSTVSLADLAAGEVYLNGDAAEELAASSGDTVLVLAGKRVESFRVRAIVEFDGAGTDGGAVLAPLASAQRLLGLPGMIEHILVSNRGDETSGVSSSDAVVDLLGPTLAPLGLEADKEKEDGLEIADAEGNAFMTLFTTFGSFSIAAGVLLIFLIFVMLAAERRGELGIARAVGTRRSHLVQMYVFEGVAYDLVAALVGALLGVLVAYGMVLVMAKALGSFGVEILYDVKPRSLVVAYALGVLLTLVVVAVSAWRVSVLTIATAVRNLPEPPKQGNRKRRWVLPVLGLLLGSAMILSGISNAQAIGFLLGVSLVLLSVVPFARALGAPDRVAHTAAGVAIVVLWLIPLDTFDFIADFASGFELFLAGGLLIVVGATWTLMYNAQLLLGAVSWALGGIRALAPMLKLSMAYPLRSLFRTGVTLAMFMLVVFTLVAGVTISGSFNRAFDNLETFGGGFDVRAVAAPASPLRDLNSALRDARAIDRTDIVTAASQSIVPLEARQADTDRGFESYPVTGVDDAFLSNATFPLAAIADGYRSSDDVWRAIGQRPGLAVVDPFVAPRRDHFGGAVLPDFQLSGFYVEDGRFRPTPVDVRDEQTGTTIRLTVIGVLADTAPDLMVGITTSQRTLASALGARAQPTVYWLDLRDDASPTATATALESAFLANGVEAEALQETLDDNVAASKTFNFIIEGFMGLGLVVGVAALGVITARAVVERRQQIGVLRSIGFQKRMIQAAFLAESSFIALTAIVVGSGLGLVLSYNVIADQRKLASWESLAFTVPWLSLALIFLIVYVVALLTTLAPAVRASRVYPAEALRYQ